MYTFDQELKRSGKSIEVVESCESGGWGAIWSTDIEGEEHGSQWDKKLPPFLINMATHWTSLLPHSLKRGSDGALLAFARKGVEWYWGLAIGLLAILGIYSPTFPLLLSIVKLKWQLPNFSWWILAKHYLVDSRTFFVSSSQKTFCIVSMYSEMSFGLLQWRQWRFSFDLPWNV